MERPVFESERALPKARASIPLPSGGNTQRTRPAAGRPAADARATRPDVDLVPKSQRSPSERTVVMPNAPGRPAHAGTSPNDTPRFPSAVSSTARSQRSITQPPTRDAASTVPPLEALVPRTTSDRPPKSGRPPPSTQTSSSTSNRPPKDAGSPFGSLSHSGDLAHVPPAPKTMPLQDETVAMYRGNWTPSAPPIAFGPVAHAPPTAPPPANVRTRPPSTAPPANVAVPLPMPASAITAPPAVEAPGVLGLVLFAAPLAFATMAVAALALL